MQALTLLLPCELGHVVLAHLPPRTRTATLPAPGSQGYVLLDLLGDLACRRDSDRRTAQFPNLRRLDIGQRSGQVGIGECPRVQSRQVGFARHDELAQDL